MPAQRHGAAIIAWRPVRDIDRAFAEIEETFENNFGKKASLRLVIHRG